MPHTWAKYNIRLSSYLLTRMVLIFVNFKMTSKFNSNIRKQEKKIWAYLSQNLMVSATQKFFNELKVRTVKRIAKILWKFFNNNNETLKKF